jgi:D-alanine-D-alanine ligase
MQNPIISHKLRGISLVLIADRNFKNNEDVDIEGDELEMISDEYFNDIFSALQRICKKVFHYSSPKELIENISKHKNDLVFTIYGGSKSRNRMALIPAICEAYNLKFVGADTYARIVCQDKFLSKEFARRYSIASPQGILIDNKTITNSIEDLNFPLVIKPNFEGSSIGISNSSKVHSYEEAINLVGKLQDQFQQPILVEEFIEGKEISVCIIGNSNEIKLFEVMEVFFEENPDFLLNKLYTAREKHNSSMTTCHRSMTAFFTESQLQNIRSLYNAMGKMDYMRIDGRFNENGFIMIELTPDGYLGQISSFKDAALIHKKTYDDLLSMIIHSALENYHTPYSNYKES